MINGQDLDVKRRNELRDGFLQLKYDLNQAREIISYSGENELLRNIMKELHYALIAPAYNFNKLLDEAIDIICEKDIINTISMNSVEEGTLLELIALNKGLYIDSEPLIIELHNCLISIKTALDRLVRVFALYKKGLGKKPLLATLNLTVVEDVLWDE